MSALQTAVLLQLLPTLHKIRYAELASSTIILLEHVLTFDQEIHLIWPARWSIGKILFLVNRYYALCIVIFNNYVLFNMNPLSDQFCKRWFQWQGATGVICFVLAEVTLLLRLYALYFRDKRVLACTALVCLSAAGSASYTMGHALSLIDVHAVELPMTGTTVCVPFNIPNKFYLFWIPMIVSESIFCGLALFRGFQRYRERRNVLQSGQRIIEILVRDSLFYFAVIFATYLTNAIVFLTRPDSEVEIPIGFAVALASVMSSRLCLNVRGHVRDDESPTLSSGTTSSPASRPGTYGPASSSFSFSFGLRLGLDDDETEAETEMMRSRSRSGRLGSLVVSGGSPLGPLEMRELRSMRAESPGAAKHMRMFSLARKESKGGSGTQGTVTWDYGEAI